jgi:ABC-type multidrug transport system fused ATPase/permease subunit
MFGISGENLTRRLRSKGFKTMLSQEIGWFDEPDNNIGALTTRLAVEAAAVQGVKFKKKNYNSKRLNQFDSTFVKATGIRIGMVLMNISNFGVGLVIAFYYGWEVTLLILGFVPFMIISGTNFQILFKTILLHDIFSNYHFHPHFSFYICFSRIEMKIKNYFLYNRCFTNQNVDRFF